MTTRRGIMTTRRQFLKLSTAAGVGLLLPWNPTVRRAVADPVPQPLDGTTIDKFVAPLAIPGVMPQTNIRGSGRGPDYDYYEIGVAQFKQQVLPKGLPKTTVWGYGSVNHSGTLSYPALTIEAKVGIPVRVKWINALVDDNGHFLPHLFSDAFKMMPPIPELAAAAGPVPIVPHLHGGHTDEESDGYPEAWFQPVGYGGTFPCTGADCYNWDRFRAEFRDKYRVRWAPGTATFQYTNDQYAATLWYHDHTFDITAINVYAGMAGFYLLRGGAYDLPDGVLPGSGDRTRDSRSSRTYEIPLVIQERKFNTDGSLRYQSGLGDTWVVNGRTWPYLEVEPRRYRFRILNGSNNIRNFMPLNLGFSVDLPFYQIGVDGGFLRTGPQERTVISLSPAERADVIVDFGTFQPGAEFYLQNNGDSVLKLKVVSLQSRDRSVPPDQLQLPQVPYVSTPVTTRVVGANFSNRLRAVCNGTFRDIAWDDTECPVTETPLLNTVEQWAITAIFHPIHLHQTQFDIVGAMPWEDGPKDTVWVSGLKVINAPFDLPGRYVWHCHILEHEDMGMMRPIQVG